jgi:hypothetical protein
MQRFSAYSLQGLAFLRYLSAVNWGWEGMMQVELGGRQLPCGEGSDPGLSALGLYTGEEERVGWRRAFEIGRGHGEGWGLSVPDSRARVRMDPGRGKRDLTVVAMGVNMKLCIALCPRAGHARHCNVVANVHFAMLHSSG